MTHGGQGPVSKTTGLSKCSKDSATGSTKQQQGKAEHSARARKGQGQSARQCTKGPGNGHSTQVVWVLGFFLKGAAKAQGHPVCCIRRCKRSTLVDYLYLVCIINETPPPRIKDPNYIMIIKLGHSLQQKLMHCQLLHPGRVSRNRPMQSFIQLSR